VNSRRSKDDKKSEMEKLRVFDEGLVQPDGSQTNGTGVHVTKMESSDEDTAANNIPVLLRTFTRRQIECLHGQRGDVDTTDSGAVTVGPDSQAQEFLSRVVHQCEAQSQDEFLRLFSGTNGRLTPDSLNAINRVRSLIGLVYPWDGSQASKQPLKAAAIGRNRSMEQENSLASKQKVIRRESFMARSSLFLYQRALCHVVYTVHNRTKVLSSRVARDMMSEVEFNLSLAHAALEIVGFVHHLEDARFSGGFPRITEKVKREKKLSEFVIALGWMQSAFPHGSDRQNPPMPGASCIPSEQNKGNTNITVHR